MNQKTPTVAGKQLSSSLKEKLKRCGRYHSSPVVKTPGTKHLETSQSVTCSNERTMQSETPAKKICINQSPELRTSFRQNENYVITSLSTPNVKPLNGRAKDICEPECAVDFSKSSTPLSELQNNPDSVSYDHALQCNEKITVTQSVINSVYKPETVQICNSSKTLRDPSYNGSEKADCDTNVEPLKNLNVCSDSSDESLMSGSSLSVRLTPVSSRSSLRLNQVRVNKLDFDKEAERIGSLPVSGSDCSIKPLGVDKTGAQLGRCENSVSASYGSVNKTKPQHLCETDTEETFAEKERLLKEISEQEEILRKLKMVKMYRTKNNLTQLESLIEKWRDVAQQGFQDLHEALPEPKPSLTELLQHLGTDFNLVKFNPIEETFS